MPAEYQCIHCLIGCLAACAGMTGSLVVKGVKSHQYKNFKVDEAEWPPQYWKLVLKLEGDVSVAFADPRRSGYRCFCRAE